MERLKSMKNILMTCAEGQMTNLSEVDAQELGEVIDMIKDLEETIYYCTVVEAMKKAEEQGYSGDYSRYQAHYSEPYYRDMDKHVGRMYYGDSRMMQGGSGGGSGGNSGGSSNSGSSGGARSSGGGSSGGNSSSGSGGSGGSSNSSAYYSEREYPMEWRDRREGRSPKSRRMYMESKETHQDKIAQMRELERYVQELTQDVIEMVEDASPEEKQYLSKRVTALGNKLSQLTND